ncbi:hypothetical protein HYH02_005713 [Chlamydomonas schloesseri]|uniref:Golgi apparatus protein 1 n=1 Tax=Chlamydomonas schloesseri TaxID=2026947 RepID=A0A836B6S1_9CHLO|nr:hypothetical protein HYH02_005713 [Chlamydomonas schloesseri]|eukprot:KAG2448959.1 hypothetical protein HYH02_005713 [Chlamydomonas schloesseri]
MTPGRAWRLLFGCGLLTAVQFLTATAAELSVLRKDEQVQEHTSKPWSRLLLAASAAQAEVSSPDVGVTGACASDILAHCKHLLAKDAGKAAKKKASLSRKIVQAAKLGHAAAAAKGKAKAKAKAKKAKKPAASQASQAQAAAGTGAAAGSAAGTGAAAAQQVKNHRQLLQAAAGAGAAAGGTGAAAGAGAGAQQTAVNATTGSAGAAAGTAAGAGATTAGGAASSNQTAAASTAATSTATTAANITETKSAGTQGTAAAGATAGNAAANGTGSAAGTAVAADQAAAGATSSDTAAGTVAAGEAAAANTTAQAAAAADAADATANDAEADADAAGAVEVSLETKAALAELNAAEAQRDDLSVALLQLGLTSPMTSGIMAIAAAPLARCLRGVMHASEMSINPNTADVADECKAEVRSVLIKRAGDVRYDPPLLAACAHDIITHCDYVGTDTAGVLGCLKQNKGALLPGCRGAVTARQAAAAEDLALDPDLQRHCGAERDVLCLEAGWGSGAAQACLLGHLRGSLPQVFSEVIFPTSPASAAATGSGGAAASTAEAARRRVELSVNCSAALVQRLIEEGEDIRLNFRLSAACAGDKQALCRDVRPGGAAVLRCLEDHIESPNLQEECRDALTEVRQLRSLDVRLDHTFTAYCATDVRTLCSQEVSEQLDGGAHQVPFGLTAPFECLRAKLELVRDATCRRHLYGSVIAAFNDNRLDAGLMRGCHQEIALHCGQHPARALECLRDKIEKFSKEDSPAVLKGKVSDTCMRLVVERQLQAATDVAFVPDLMEACAREHATYCASPDIEGARALECLADHRTEADFGERCGEALRDFLADAARDIRTMSGLQADCKEEIATMCKGIQPGEGRVISCLRDNRANITGELCRRQVLRLLGFLVEDHRLDAKLTQACTSDVQKFCGGVEVGDGQVHDCLRRSADHLSPECRAAEEEVEQLEHEDVRLNPKLMRECPLAVSSFCGDVPPGDARVISCLQSNMDKGHFPPGCRAALLALTDRASTKYSLNYRLRLECDEDAEKLCPEAVDEAGHSRKANTGTGGSHNEETTLACLARQSSQLASSCRSELQALVKLSLNRYRVGMPLTSQCDGDVMQRCQVDQMAAPFLQSGYVLGCLAKNAAKLHKPCWELVSTMDEGQFKRAAAAESTHWAAQGGGGVSGALDEKTLAKVVADVRRDLEPRLFTSVHEQVHRNAHVVARNVSGALLMSIAPKVNALMHTTVSLLMLTFVGLVGAFLVWKRYGAGRGGLLVVRKDGSV